MRAERLTVGGHTIEIERADKLMFSKDGITKGDLIDYYHKMAETMLPYMQERPLTMQRFPDGIEQSGFYQKEAPGYFPDWIRRVSIKIEGSGEMQEQIICDDAATLIYLANQACVTPHIWLSRADNLYYPDKLIFDLDPPTDDFEPVRQAAQDLHKLLKEIELPSYVMTTGSRGLHVVVPLDRSADFDTVHEFTRDLAAILSQRHPDRLTIAHRKEKRDNRLFVDYLRNSYGQNSVSPYSVRALDGAPVATPLDWDELTDPELTSRSYCVRNIFRRLGQKSDPWQGMTRQASSLADPSHELKRKAS